MTSPHEHWRTLSRPPWHGADAAGTERAHSLTQLGDLAMMGVMTFDERAPGLGLSRLKPVPFGQGSGCGRPAGRVDEGWPVAGDGDLAAPVNHPATISGQFRIDPESWMASTSGQRTSRRPAYVTAAHGGLRRLGITTVHSHN